MKFAISAGKARVGGVVGVVTLLVMGLMLLTSGPSAASPAGGVTLSKANDADHDGVFSAVENVPKNVTYPWTVTYELTIFGGTAPGPGGNFHTINSITDNTTTNLGSCKALIGTNIAVGQTETCTYTVTLTGPGSAPLVNVAHLGYDGVGNDIDRATSTVNFPAMTLTKSSTTKLINAGGQVVPYTYVITNTGTVTLTGITLSDNKTDAPPTCPATTLAVGSSMTCTGQHTVTSAEVAAGGNLVNVATATSNEAPNRTATLSIPIAAMTLTKSSTTTFINASGQVVPYTYVITNTGAVTLTGITLSDNNTDAPPSCPATTLAVGSSMTCTGQHTVTTAEFLSGGNLVNVATATSNETPNQTATLSIPIAAMTLTKSSTTKLITAGGQVVPYTYVITNTGAVTLTGITLSDNNTDAPPSCPATTLAVGSSMTCTGQHTVTTAEFLAGGNLVNVATATSNETPNQTATLSIPIAKPTCRANPPKVNVRWHYSANGSSGSWSGTSTAPCGATFSMGPQAMEGNLHVTPGTTLMAGYDFTLPGNNSAFTVSFSSAQVVFGVKCVSGATPSQPTFTVTMPNQSYAVTGSNWFPSGQQNSPLVYQGSIAVPDLCAGGALSLSQGGTFSAFMAVS